MISKDSLKTLMIDRLAFGGEGVGRVDGKVTFVPGGVPGDRVSVRVTADHGKYDKGEIVEILEPSPHRVDPPCAYFSRCGGCQWQHLDYVAQIHWKREIVIDALRRVGRVAEPPVEAVIPAANPWNYRKRIQMQVDAQGRMGFHALKSHDVIEIDRCHIADEALNAKLEELRAQKNFPQENFEISRNGDSRVHVVPRVSEEAVFSQVHAAQNENLVRVVLDYAFGQADAAFTRKKKVIELYAGSGNLTFPLAERAGDLFAVEENASAVAAGEKESLRREVSNVTWIQGHSEWGLQKLHRRRIHPDLLVLDPPRRGAKEIMDLICVMKPRAIVYVSCDPVTLSRDVELLTRRHYRLDKVQPIDMFPQTYHIETVSRLSLRPH